MKKIITIGRQFGSGGRAIGRMLADQLGYSFYDKEILSAAAKKLGVCEALLEQNSESASSLSTFIYNALLNNREQSFEDKLAKQEFDYLRKQTKKGPCVIIGRCSSWLFRDDPDTLSIFVTAPMEKRVDRLLALHQDYGLEEGDREEAQRLILQTDKKRASYYNYYTDQHWDDLSQYHLILDSTVLGIENTASVLAELIRRT